MFLPRLFRATSETFKLEGEDYEHVYQAARRDSVSMPEFITKALRLYVAIKKHDTVRIHLETRDGRIRAVESVSGHSPL